MNEKCPVCAYDRLPYPPNNYHICPCCGTEFGNDDANYSHAQLREMWIAMGAHWFFGIPPERWNPWLQLIRGGYESFLKPKFMVTLGSGRTTVADLVTEPNLILRLQGA